MCIRDYKGYVDAKRLGVTPLYGSKTEIYDARSGVNPYTVSFVCIQQWMHRSQRGAVLHSKDAFYDAMPPVRYAE